MTGLVEVDMKTGKKRATNDEMVVSPSAEHAAPATEQARILGRLLENPVLAEAALRQEFATVSSVLIRRSREAAGLTQAELARKVGVSQPRVAQLESGSPDDGVPEVVTLAKLLRACGKKLSLSAG
jgi:DNA-binding XRE family transcriptional regulator